MWMRVRRFTGLNDDGHCIWEIVLHAAYWRREVAHALSGGVIARLVEAGGVGGAGGAGSAGGAGGVGGRGPVNWPALPGDGGIPGVRDEAHWQADRQLLDEAEAALIAALDGFDVQRWSEPPPPEIRPEDEVAAEDAGGDGDEENWSLGQYAIGLIAHDAYHIGQAVMLKKAARLGLK